MQTTELRSCVKVGVAVLGSPSYVILMVFVDVKEHWTRCKRLFKAERKRDHATPLGEQPTTRTSSKIGARIG